MQPNKEDGDDSNDSLDNTGDDADAVMPQEVSVSYVLQHVFPSGQTSLSSSSWPSVSLIRAALSFLAEHVSHATTKILAGVRLQGDDDEEEEQRDVVGRRRRNKDKMQI
jgi:hypothetical protein